MDSVARFGKRRGGNKTHGDFAFAGIPTRTGHRIQRPILSGLCISASLLSLLFSSSWTMLATENASTLDLPPRPSAVVDVISDALSNASIQPDSSSNNKDSPVSPTLQNVQTSRPFITYTRSQLLHLHKSPLVKVPDGMPAFKDWFGCVTSSLSHPNTDILSEALKVTKATSRKTLSRLHSSVTLETGGAFSLLCYLKGLFIHQNLLDF